MTKRLQSLNRKLCKKIRINDSGPGKKENHNASCDPLTTKYLQYEVRRVREQLIPLRKTELNLNSTPSSSTSSSTVGEVERITPPDLRASFTHASPAVVKTAAKQWKKPWTVRGFMIRDLWLTAQASIPRAHTVTYMRLSASTHVKNEAMTVSRLQNVLRHYSRSMRTCRLKLKKALPNIRERWWSQLPKDLSNW